MQKRLLLKALTVESIDFRNRELITPSKGGNLTVIQIGIMYSQ